MHEKGQRPATVHRRTERPRAGGVPGPGGPSSILQLQRLAGNRAVTGLLTGAGAGGALPIQRVKDSFDATLDDKKLRLAVGFTGKHVAADAAAAEQVTQKRYDDGKMPAAMANGRIPNTVAKSATWLEALSASSTKVDTETDQWTNDVALQVGEAWEVKWMPRQGAFRVTEVSSLPLIAGGYGQAEYAAGGRRNKAKQVTGGSFVMNHISDG